MTKIMERALRQMADEAKNGDDCLLPHLVEAFGKFLQAINSLQEPDRSQAMFGTIVFFQGFINPDVNYTVSPSQAVANLFAQIGRDKDVNLRLYAGDLVGYIEIAITHGFHADLLGLVREESLKRCLTLREQQDPGEDFELENIPLTSSDMQ